LIDVRKRLTIRSTHGAGVTVLDAGRASLPDGVALLTDGVVFGQQGSGFTITGLNTVPAECFGVALLVQGSNVSVGGNVVTGNTVLRGIDIQGRGNKIVGNLVSQNSVGDFGVLVSSDGNTMLTGNVASGNVGTGCFARPGGFFFHGEVVANGNAAVGNSLIGFMVDRFPAAPRSGQMLTKNVVAGNLGPGIFVVGNGTAAPLTLTQNNIYGNDSAGANCGVFNETGGNITVANNFWGAVTGPGGNPADDVCDGGGATTISTPFAAAPFAIPNGLAGK